MYGRVAGANTAAGVALLPATGDSRVLLIVAGTLIAAGAVIMVAGVLMARKSRKSVAQA